MTTTPLRLPVHEVTVGAFDGDDLVSGAQVFFSHGIAGVYCVGTAESARGRVWPSWSPARSPTWASTAARPT